jgi:hypothetical protein
MGESEYFMQYVVAERLREARATHQAVRGHVRQGRRAVFAILANIVENAGSGLMNMYRRAIFEG